MAGCRVAECGRGKGEDAGARGAGIGWAWLKERGDWQMALGLPILKMSAGFWGRLMLCFLRLRSPS